MHNTTLLDYVQWYCCLGARPQGSQSLAGLSKEKTTMQVPRHVNELAQYEGVTLGLRLYLTTTALWLLPLLLKYLQSCSPDMLYSLTCYTV